VTPDIPRDYLSPQEANPIGTRRVGSPLRQPSFKTRFRSARLRQTRLRSGGTRFNKNGQWTLSGPCRGGWQFPLPRFQAMALLQKPIPRCAFRHVIEGAADTRTATTRERRIENHKRKRGHGNQRTFLAPHRTRRPSVSSFLSDLRATSAWAPGLESETGNQDMKWRSHK
jgi:hypothetical protein